MNASVTEYRINPSAMNEDPVHPNQVFTASLSESTGLITSMGLNVTFSHLLFQLIFDVYRPKTSQLCSLSNYIHYLKASRC